MANVLNRRTMQYLTSVHTPAYDPNEWVINPELSAVKGVPVKLWVLEGNKVRKMSQLEEVQTYLPVEIEKAARQLGFELELYIDQHYDAGQKASLTAAWVEGGLKGYQKRVARIEQVWTWVKAVIDYFYAVVRQMMGARSFAQLESIKWDFSAFDAGDPLVSVAEVKQINE